MIVRRSIRFEQRDDGTLLMHVNMVTDPAGAVARLHSLMASRDPRQRKRAWRYIREGNVDDPMTPPERSYIQRWLEEPAEDVTEQRMRRNHQWS